MSQHHQPDKEYLGKTFYGFFWVIVIIGIFVILYGGYQVVQEFVRIDHSPDILRAQEILADSRKRPTTQ